MLTMPRTLSPCALSQNAIQQHALALLVVLLTAGSSILPQIGYANPLGVAVIIGNRNYTNDRVPEVPYAHRDARAFRHFLLDVLRFTSNDIIDLSDATHAEMKATFGSEFSHEGKVWRLTDSRPGAHVVVFYSGHGVPGLQDGRGYLLPVDADPEIPESNGYPIDLLYKNMGKLKAARSVQLFIDASFSGNSPRGMLVHSASPVNLKTYLLAGLTTWGDKILVVTAASSQQVALWDSTSQHGLFTNYLLEALYGKGDANDDGQVTAVEAKDYLDENMTPAAFSKFNRLQNVSLNRATDAMIVSTRPTASFPVRQAIPTNEGK